MKKLIKKYNRMSILTHKKIQNLSPLLMEYGDVEVVENCLILALEEIGRLLTNNVHSGDYMDYITGMVITDLSIIEDFDMFYPGLSSNCKDYIIELIDKIVLDCVEVEKYEAASNLQCFKKLLENVYEE